LLVLVVHTYGLFVASTALLGFLVLLFLRLVQQMLGIRRTVTWCNRSTTFMQFALRLHRGTALHGWWLLGKGRGNV